MEKAFRKTGIDIIGDASWGTHLCQFYETREDLVDILVPYFKAGLENNEFCMWITSEPLKFEDAKAALKKVVKNLDHFIKKGQIEIWDYSEWYTKSGKFDANNVLQGWVEKENQALKRGYDGLRLSGNTFWLEEKDWRNFTDYEEEINNVIGKYRMMAICTYSLAKCGASEVIDVISNHQFALIRREGKWVIIESSGRKRAEEVLRESEERYRRLVETAPEVIYNLSAEDGTITLLNPAFEKITGWSRAEWLGKPFMSLVHPDDVTLAMETFQHVSRGEATPPYELRILSKSGEYLIGEFTSYPNIEKRKVIGEFGIARDITERKRAEKEIQNLAKFPSENPNPVLRIARDGLLLYVNEAGLRQLAELHLQVGQAAPPMLREVVFQVMENGSSQVLDLEHRQRMYSFFVAPVVDTGYANLYGRDITERKRAEEALRESEGKYQALLETINDAIYAVDPSGVITYISPAAKKITKYEPEELIGKNFFVFVHEADREKLRSRLRELFEGVVRPFEYRLVDKDGLTIWVRSFSAIVRSESGTVMSITGVLSDITERKQAEEELKKSAQILRDAGEMAKVGAWELDLSAKEVLMTEEVCRIHGVEPGYKPKLEEAIKFYAPESIPALEATLKKTMETGEPYDLESLFIPSGSKDKIWVRSLGRAIYSGGKIVKLAGTFQNIDKYKRAEAERERLLADLEAKNRELEAFVYTISHDLKTPLVSLGGFSSVLQKEHESQLDEEGKHCLERIQANVANMEALISSLLELSRIGQVVGQIEEIDVAVLLRKIRDALAIRLKEAGAEFVVQEPLPTVRADRGRIHQVFANLIDNALKFRSTERALRIEVGCRQESGFYRFHVADNGIGIAPQHHEQIFAPFRKLHSEIEGGGIGLALVKKIVEHHGGRVWVESPSAKFIPSKAEGIGTGNEEAGATFYFTLPIERGVKSLS